MHSLAGNYAGLHGADILLKTVVIRDIPNRSYCATPRMKNKLGSYSSYEMLFFLHVTGLYSYIYRLYIHCYIRGDQQYRHALYTQFLRKCCACVMPYELSLYIKGGERETQDLS